MYVSERWVDRDSGRLVAQVIHLWPNTMIDGCPMCGRLEYLTHAVGWYCGPTRDPIGSVSTEYVGGGEVGGRCVCKGCHDQFYACAV